MSRSYCWVTAFVAVALIVCSENVFSAEDTDLSSLKSEIEKAKPLKGELEEKKKKFEKELISTRAIK